MVDIDQDDRDDRQDQSEQVAEDSEHIAEHSYPTSRAELEAELHHRQTRIDALESLVKIMIDKMGA